MLKTSFFNKAIFKRNLHGYWPLWAAYLGILLLIIPVPIYSSLKYGYYESAADLSVNFFNTAFMTSLIVGAFFAVFATMAVFSYMYTSRAANMTASLPIKRETLFSTNFISILFVTVAAHLITAVVTILTVALYDISLLYILPILQWVALGVLMTFFFICLSCFCATLTGSILILPCIYGIINFAVIVINMLLTSIFSVFLYGYSASYLPEATIWLTPFIKLFTMSIASFGIAHRTTYINIQGTDISAILLYAVSGIIFLIFAFLIHKKRRTETASDIIAVKPLKPVAKYLFSALGSLALGILINELLFGSSDANPVGYGISMLIGGFIGYFASEMLISKSFKVWHKWKGFAIYCALIIAFLIGLSCDIIGFETSIPSEDSISVATVELFGEPLESSDPDTISVITDLHKYIIDNRDNDIDYNKYFASVNISYKLKSGAQVKRTYYCNISQSIVDFYNSPKNCLERTRFPSQYTSNDILNISVEYYDGSETWTSETITTAQFMELYNTYIPKDIGTSSLGTTSFGGNEPQAVVYIYVDFDNSGNYYYYFLEIPTDAVNCLNYLHSLGIDYTVQ